jgi:hypothetical protein
MKTLMSFVWMIAGAIGLFLLKVGFLALTEGIGEIVSLLLALVACFVAVIVYRLMMNHLFGRPTPEIAGQRMGMEIVLGALTGAILLAMSISAIAVAGGYAFQWKSDVDTVAVLLATIEAALLAAVIEELVFRGLMFQTIQRLGGRWVALAITSLLFGAAHLGNPEATLWSSFAIAVEAGILLGAAFLWCGNLWYAIGMHFAWNATVALMGIPVSGNTSNGLFHVEVKDPELLTGGAFGIEGSLVVVVSSLAISIPMLYAAVRKQQQTHA